MSAKVMTFPGPRSCAVGQDPLTNLITPVTAEGSLPSGEWYVSGPGEQITPPPCIYLL